MRDFRNGLSPRSRSLASSNEGGNDERFPPFPDLFRQTPPRLERQGD